MVRLLETLSLIWANSFNFHATSHEAHVHQQFMMAAAGWPGRSCYVKQFHYRLYSITVTGIIHHGMKTVLLST